MARPESGPSNGITRICLLGFHLQHQLSLFRFCPNQPWDRKSNTGSLLGDNLRNYHCYMGESVQFSSVALSCPTLWPHEPQHARPPCPSTTSGVYSNSCPLSRWCHPTISPSVVPFSSCTHSSPASGSFQMSQLSASGGQHIGVSASASALPMNTQDWSLLGWTGWISLQSKGYQTANTYKYLN